jgi:tetrahydromethanopterin S-methyltransferase subunit E
MCNKHGSAPIIIISAIIIIIIIIRLIFLNKKIKHSKKNDYEFFVSGVNHQLVSTRM